MPEKPGSFKHYCELVGPMNISEFKYRYNLDKQVVVLYTGCSIGETGANVLVGIQVARGEIDEFQACGSSLGYDYVVVTDDNEFSLLMH
ncbi:hypothetical protein PRUPE_1G149200 [Prunus persica]|uniref:Uncharacterized protein n=1 Tax=Prunus persica TaxID=3760 RepID=M5Y1A5_PRUPE|nr:hypothetical protein PRUPE_1G149200 [Prunus persica]